MKQSGYTRILAYLFLLPIIGLFLGIALFFLNQSDFQFMAKFRSISKISDLGNGYSRLVGPHQRFSFEYPSTWRLDRYDKKGEYILDYPENFVTVSINEQSYEITDGSIMKNFSEALETQKAELLKKGYTNFSKSSQTKENIHIFQLNYDLTPLDNINRKGMFFYIVKQTTFYSISMGVSEKNYNQTIGDFKRLIQSFK